MKAYKFDFIPKLSSVWEHNSVTQARLDILIKSQLQKKLQMNNANSLTVCTEMQLERFCEPPKIRLSCLNVHSTLSLYMFFIIHSRCFNDFAVNLTYCSEVKTGQKVCNN